MLALLEHLKDDPSLYVRRSVANNLNDIGKDHPALLVDVARRWLDGAAPERRWIVRHALRSAVKRAEPAALEILGYRQRGKVELLQAAVVPSSPSIGAHVEISFGVLNPGRRRLLLLLDLRVHYVKANGRAQPKVFKLKSIELAAGETAWLSKRLSLAEMTTRRHYPGEHLIEVLANGQAVMLGSFALRAGPSDGR